MTFQPPLNLDFSQVQIEMPPGSTIERTSVVANKVTRLLRSKPEVENAFADVGPTSAELFVTLKKDRERSSVEFERAYALELQAIPDARINFQSQAGDGSGRDLNVTLVADDPAKMQQAAEKIIAEMRRLPEIRAPRINGELQRPEITVKPRLDLAADLGVTTAALSQTIRIATLGDIDQNSAKFSLSDRQVPIRVAMPVTSRRNLATIENLPVPTASGGSVPLKHVAEISFGAGPSEVKRYNQRRRTAIGADLAPGIVTSDAMKKIEALPAVQNLPDGVEKVVSGGRTTPMPMAAPAAAFQARPVAAAPRGVSRGSDRRGGFSRRDPPVERPSLTQQFFAEGDRQESTSYKGAILDDSDFSTSRGFDSFDKIPTRRTPLILAILLLLVAGGGLAWWVGVRPPQSWTESSLWQRLHLPSVSNWFRPQGDQAAPPDDR
jgi:hypothetical protein